MATLPGKSLNVFGDKGSAKTHLSKILEKKKKKIKIIGSQKINDQIISKLNDLDCLIIDNFNNDINEKLLY